MLRHRCCTAAKERKSRICIGRFQFLHQGGCLKSNSANQHGHHGLGIYIDPGCPHCHVDTAGLPETRFVCYILVIRCMHKNLDVERLAVAGKVITNDLSYIQTAVIEGRTNTHRTEIVGLQNKCPARLINGNGWRNVAPDEIMPGLFRLSHFESDKVAGQQCTDAGNAAQGNTRLFNPEFGIFYDQSLGAFVNLRRHDDFCKIR